jgi:hypothetical protein
MKIELSTDRLSLGAQSDDAARVHLALQALGREIPVAEAKSRVFGPGSVAVVRALQQEMNLPASGMIDDATVRIINVLLEKRTTAPRVVRGSVRDADGRAFDKGFVQIFGQSLQGEAMLGKSPLRDGTYQISYQPPADGNRRVDLRVAVFDDNGQLETLPDGASLLTEAGPIEVVDFVLSGKKQQPGVEFDILHEELKRLVGAREFSDLEEDEKRREISLLAAQSGYSTEQVAGLVLAHKLAKGTSVPAEVYYGLIRQGLPRNANAIHAVHPDERKKALKSAVEQRLVPKEIAGKKIEDFLVGLAPAPPAELRDLLGHILTADQLTAFAGKYLQNSDAPDKFWQQVAADATLGSRAEELKFAVQLGALTNSHTPLVAAVRSMPEMKQATDLVRLTENEWKTLIQTQGVGVPADTPGASADDKVNTYAQHIIRQVEAAFPTRFFAERLGATPVANFLKAQPDYDLRRTYAGKFFKENPSAAQLISKEDQQQLVSFQRLYRLTESTTETLSLAATGIQSAQQVARMGRTAFAQQHAETFSASRAEAVYNQARQAHATSLMLFAEHASDLNRTGMHALPQPNRKKQAELAAQSIPDWETLFGAFDFCACRECASVHGPAAYLVDILEFLGNRSARAALFARRPDLGHIELSCENTNTPLPLIDLATEVLEDVVAPPSAFAPLSLNPALELDLGQETATPALAAAFVPSLQNGARVETLETGKRWRIWDRPFSYSVVKEGLTLKVVLRSRQTTGTAAERRATPQYRNSAAYVELKEAVYPWTLPLDLAREEAGVFLTHLGVSRHEVIEALRPQVVPFDPNDSLVVRLAVERLGFTNTERSILLNESLTPPRSLQDFWGGNPVSQIVTVQDLLDRSGLKYSELEQLIAAWFINSAGAFEINPISDASLDTCDTTRLKVNGLTENVLSSLHRFVRLWRKLGWTIEETDQVLRALTPGSDTLDLNNKILVRLDHFRTLCSQLRLPVARALSLWKPIDATGSDRHALLAQQLGLPVLELSIAIELTGLDPFDADRSEEAVRFVEAVRAVLKSGFSFTHLDYLLRHRANPAASFVPEQTAMSQTLLDVLNKLLQIDSPQASNAQKLKEGSVVDSLAAALKLPADVTGALLNRVRHGDRTALQHFLELPAVTAEVLSRDAALPQLKTLEKLLKITSVIQTLHLSGSDLTWLFLENDWLTQASDPSGTAVPFKSWFSMIQLQQLRQELNLEDGAREAILASMAAVSAAVGSTDRQAARKVLVDTLTQWLGWPQSDLETLIGPSNDIADLGLLHAAFPDDYRVGLLLRLQRGMKLLKRVGVSAVEASQWCDDVVEDSHAMAVRAAAKAKHEEPAWQKLVVPLQDTLRDRQREALVAYLAARPQLWKTQSDATDLYSQFLIDVEMSSCQLTSRIKQAIGSVQLFTQRCLLGLLNPEVLTNDPEWAQWEWMKNFRVWEANRKIWLYPENWIEPQLRDDKTPFFKELEEELLQGELTEDAAEQALRHYLEKLDEVARLQIAGMYEDDETKDLHIFGRTFHMPHIYYYRRREGKTKAWRPWEKVELDIEGNHLIPVVWNRKLMVIWPIFAEKSYPKEVEMPGPGGKLEAADRYWEIQLAWSEYRSGGWSAKNVSEPVAFEAYQGEDTVLFGRPVQSASQTTYMLRKNDGDSQPSDLPVDMSEPTPPPQTPNAPTPRRLVGKELLLFKAMVRGDTLIIRGFLRRDYRRTPAPGDKQIASCFGEFRFSGCRKIVTTAHRRQISGLNFPLAPAGTEFEYMQFSGNGGRLALFDGKFPVGLENSIGGAMAAEEINERGSIALDPSSTVENKQDIPVLDRTPSAFRLLAPHQDLQFVGDRPFFFTDFQRAFLAKSTGSSGKRSMSEAVGWVNGDLAVARRADYFPTSPLAAPDDPVVQSRRSTDALRPFTLLKRGPKGDRVATQMAQVNLRPAYVPRTMMPVFWTTRNYRFFNFHHPYVCEFVKTLNRGGISALLSLATQQTKDGQSFASYLPQHRVVPPHPIDEVEFEADRAYAVYNWELFFHIPLLVADQLSKNQQFAEALRWFHFIFNPTIASGDNVPQRFWRTLPFYQRLALDYEKESVLTIEKIAAAGGSPEIAAAVANWRNNPFSPHAVARLRTTAYQKMVVMKYIDNLIAWGDQLFRRETIESINEATHLYVLAAEILGRRAEVIDRQIPTTVKTFNSLTQVGPLSNSLEQIELLIANAGEEQVPDAAETPDLPSAQVLNFCVLENGKLLGYWNTVADRLFKIRHCMNMKGQVRQLPLFEPPIDPALMVRARAAGLSISEVFSEISVPLPHYRFSVMLQKANELANEVRNLAGDLLSALEKKDAEALSILRSGQEMRLLQAVRDIRKKQIDEAQANIVSLEASKQMAQARKDYYESREPLSGKEQSSQSSLKVSVYPMEGSKALRSIATVLENLGVIKMGSPTTAGIEGGPNYVAAGLLTSASILDLKAGILSVNSQLSGRMAEYDRRQEEWDHQVNLATIELEQIDKQLIAAQIRLAVAEQELRNHEQQIDNAREVDQFLRGKFTNQDLYQWMIGQVSGLYFQSYQLAYDLAKRAETCFQFELGLPQSSYVNFGYWDSLKKGLLAGEKLQYDLRRLEAAYLEENRREFEIAKHVSLALLDPFALVKLRETGRCLFDLPEEIFDLDYPGHYFRRIKSVSITLPCIVGPYTTISCTLRLTRNSIRINTANGDNGYRRNSDDDDRFVENNIPVKAIAASSAQNDSGVFELSFRDERYLPFEGAGVISHWSLELFNDSSSSDFGKLLRQFDYSTISDAVLHIKYTAREDAGQFKNGAIGRLREYFSEAQTDPGVRFFDLRQEFPTQWHRFLNPNNPADGNVFELQMSPDLFRILDQGKTLKVNSIALLARCIDGGEYNVVLTLLQPTSSPPGGTTMTIARTAEFGGLHGVKNVSLTNAEVGPSGPHARWRLQMTRPGGGNLQVDSSTNGSEVKDVYLFLDYHWGS